MADSIFYKMQSCQLLNSLKILLELTLPPTFTGRFPFLLRQIPRINYLLVLHSNTFFKAYDIIGILTLINLLSDVITPRLISESIINQCKIGRLLYKTHVNQFNLAKQNVWLNRLN